MAHGTSQDSFLLAPGQTPGTPGWSLQAFEDKEAQAEPVIAHQA
jgi:hypothetical protein